MTGPELVIADYSQWQGVVKPPPGQIVIIRAHNGYVPDPDFAANRANAHAAGAPAVGLYQYLAADPAAGSVTAQAAELLQLVGQLAANEWLICDLETGQGNEFVLWWAWRGCVLLATKRVPWLYSGLAFAQVHDLDPDWVAAYGQAEPTIPHKLWQDTDTYPWPWGPSDASVFHGTLPEFLAAAGITLPGPVVPAQPKEETMAPGVVIETTDTNRQFTHNFETGKVSEITSTEFGSGLSAPAGPAGCGWPVIKATQADVDNLVRGYAPG